jgi:hypothetical protein
MTSLLGNKPEKSSEDTPVEIPMNAQDLELQLEMEENVRMAPLVSRVHKQLEEADTSRYTAENQWIKNLQAYRGLDSNDKGKNGDKAEFRSSEEHKPYIRTTTVKTRAGFAQIMESLLQNSRFPLMIESTPVSSGAPNQAVNDPNAPESQADFGIGFAGDGRELQPGATQEALGWQDSDPLYANLKEGHDKSGGQFAQLSPASRSAEKMTKLIQDQLEESNANTELRRSVFEACLLGSGIMKGVFTEEKTIHRWVEGVYSPEKVKQPKVRSCSLWDLYVDPNAMEFHDAEWVVERHRKTAKQMRDLMVVKGFRSDKYRNVLMQELTMLISALSIS